MNFELSPDQEALRDAVARICSQFGDDYWLKKDKEGGFPSELHQALARDGWLGIAMPEEYGGSGLSPLEVCVVAEEIGRAAAPQNGHQRV